MKPFYYTLAVAYVIVFAACAKKVDIVDPPPPQPAWTPYTVPPQPELKLVRMVDRMPQPDGSTDVNTTEFSYDNRNRLTIVREIETNEIKVDFRYIGEELVKEVVHLSDGINFLEYDSNITFSRNADTIVSKYRDDRIGETIFNTQVFNDSALVEYNYSTQIDGRPNAVNQRFIYAYDRNGNLSRVSATQNGSPFATLYTVLAVDDNPNAVRYLTPFAWRTPIS